MVSAHPIHFGWLALGVICLVAVIVGGLMMDIAWDHNPQLVFHEDGVIHWGAWLTIGATWFAAIAGIPCVIAVTVLAVSLFRGGPRIAALALLSLIILIALGVALTALFHR